MLTKLRLIASAGLLGLLVVFLCGCVAVPAASAASVDTGVKTAALTVAMLLVGAVTIPGGAYKRDNKWVNAEGQPIADPSPYLPKYRDSIKKRVAPQEAWEQAQQATPEPPKDPKTTGGQKRRGKKQADQPDGGAKTTHSEGSDQDDANGQSQSDDT